MVCFSCGKAGGGRGGGGSATQISSKTRPQDLGVGTAQISAPREGATMWPWAQPLSPTVVKRSVPVGVYVVLVEETIAGAAYPANIGDIADNVVLQMIAGAAPPADVAEVVASDAASLADDGILFPADPAGMVTVGVATLAAADPVVDLADAGIPFPADPAGMLFPADPAGILFPVDLAGIPFPADPAWILFPADPAGIPFPAETAGIPFPAEPTGTPFPTDLAGSITIGVTDLADAGILFPADYAGNVTSDVESLADAGLVTVCVADLAIAGSGSCISGACSPGVLRLTPRQ